MFSLKWLAAMQLPLYFHLCKTPYCETGFILEGTSHKVEDHSMETVRNGNFQFKKKGPLSLLLSTTASSSTLYSQLLAGPKISWKQSTHRWISQTTLKSNIKNLAS